MVEDRGGLRERLFSSESSSLVTGELHSAEDVPANFLH